MTVSICIVAYNEEKALPKLFDDIKNQDYPADNIEIILVDSMSSDNTKAIMEQFAMDNLHYRRVKVLDNPKKKQAPGWNIAIRNSKEEVIIRIDAHASIPKNFVSNNIRCLKTGEAVSGGPRPNVAEEPTNWKHTLLLAESSMFGSSIANYRREGKKAYVKSLFHGAYRREVFGKAGLFNEQLGRTEDNEMHYRIRKAGYRLCFDSDIQSYQFTRSTLKKMIKQKYGNGYWVALTAKACPHCLSIYHFVPFLFLGGITITGIMALLKKPLLALVMWSVYGVTALTMSILSVRKQHKCIQQLLLPFLFLLLHLSYGLGSLVGFIKLPFWKYKSQIEKIEG